MLQPSSHRPLVAVVCCVLCLALGAFPAAALPNLDGLPASHAEVESLLVRIWRLVGEPVVSLFAADGVETVSGPTPPHSEVGVTIDPDGTPKP